jgi:putative membrane protein
MNKRTTTILWVLAAAYAVALIANITLGLGIPIAVVLLISVAFALIHGAVRYGWIGILTFVVMCLVVSNILESTSVFHNQIPLPILIPVVVFVPLAFALIHGAMRYVRPNIDVATPAPSRSHFAQATVMYALIGLGIVLAYVVGSPNTLVTDAAGVVWQSSSIAEGEATVTVYTILFATALAAVKLLQRPAAASRGN